jgi:hypothetical protein
MGTSEELAKLLEDAVEKKILTREQATKFMTMIGFDPAIVAAALSGEIPLIDLLESL